MATDPIFPGTPRFWATQVAAADATDKLTLLTAGVSGSRLDSIRLVSTDTADVHVNFYVQIGGTGAEYHLGEVPVPDGAGTDGAESIVDGLAVLTMGRPVVVGAGDVVKVAAKAALTSACTVDVTACGGDY